MEDARREFQVFLSPSRTGTEYMSSSNVQRVIPVINKIVNYSNSPFTLTQRRGSVYKAVSGISFQESDEKKYASKKNKSNFKRERSERRSIVMGHERAPKKSNETRRSRSLTSIGAYIAIENENSVPEFVHPFSPTFIQNRLGRHDKSVRARKRASSQSRRCAELSAFEVNDENIPINPHPQPPRRARSASRYRQYDRTISDEISIIQNRSCSLDQTSDISVSYSTNINKQILDTGTEATGKHMTSENRTVANFDVNESDWKTYDKLISEKLNTLLKTKEEPEGGYFSLERDECEETNGAFLDEINTFQQDYYNESIYVSQTLDHKTEPESALTTTPECPYAGRNTHECQDPDDEGLYEEIYLDNSDPIVDFPVVAKEGKGRNQQDASQLCSTPRIEQGPTSTVVYITSKNSNDNTYKSNISSSDSNQFAIMDDFLKSKRNIFLEQMNSIYFLSKDNCRNGSNNITRKAKFNGEKNDCDPQNKRANKFKKIVTLPMVSDSTYPAATTVEETKLYSFSVSENGYAKKINPAWADHTPRKIKCSADMKKSKSNTNLEKDYELSDLNFDMFAPKNITPRKKRHSRAGDSTDYEKSLLKLQQLQFKSVSNFEDKHEISDPPNTFKAFLHNSVFNPPESEFSHDYGEPLIIREDQIITCITDSSSSEESDKEGESLNSSPWLEANKDFEYVAFQDIPPPRSARKRKKGIADLANIINLQFPNGSSQYQDERKRQNNVKQVPQRPSRSKHRSKSKKRCELSK